MLQLTFNPGLTLIGFRTTRPRLLKRVSYLLIFVIWENEIVICVIRDLPFSLFVNRARDRNPVADRRYPTTDQAGDI